MTMERRTAILVVLLVSASLLQTALSTEYIVGDDTGWEYLSDTGVNFYDNWAAQQSLKVGDTLKFNWVGNHDVVQVSPADAEACSGDSESNKWMVSGVSVPLNESGQFGYYCSVPGHCTGGFMKMTVNVSEAAATSPPPPATANSPPSPPPPPGTTTPPPRGAASSLTQFCQPLVIAAVALFAASAVLFF